MVDKGSGGCSVHLLVFKPEKQIKNRLHFFLFHNSRPKLTTVTHPFQVLSVMFFHDDNPVPLAVMFNGTAQLFAAELNTIIDCWLWKQLAGFDKVTRAFKNPRIA